MRRGLRFDHGNRIPDDILDGNPVVKQGVDEAAIRPILKQPADEIRQQLMMPAHGRIDNAVRGGPLCRLRDRFR
jgi:hypothetical protein